MGERHVLGGLVGFQGQQQHSGAELVYMRNRWYDPETMRFTSPDRIIGLTVNNYSFAFNSPTNYADPLGLWGIQFGWDGPNIGWGHPTMVFTQEDAHNALKGVAAATDQLLPVPIFAGMGVYSECDEAVKWAMRAGMVASFVLPDPMKFLKAGKLIRAAGKG